MKVAIEQVFNGSLPFVSGNYNPTSISISGTNSKVGQYNLGAGENDKFIGPTPISVAYTGESALAIPASFVHPVQIHPDLFWIFANDQATAAATRRIQLWTYVPSTATTTLVGAVTLTYPTTSNHTSRGLRAILTNVSGESGANVAVSNTGVVGYGTNHWLSGICIGSRIGFGSNDPQAVSGWHLITNIVNDNTMAVSPSGNYPSGTKYVIQDLMLLTPTTNATVGNGGLFIVKGLRYEDFQQPALTIPSGTVALGTKNKAVYWLRDAANILSNNSAGGCALGDFESLTRQFCYLPSGAATNLILFKQNFRASGVTSVGLNSSIALSPAAGDSVITAGQAVTGNILQTNNGRVANVNHGPGSGVNCLYLLTTTRLVRIPLSNITAGSTTFVANQMSEVPPGGTNTNVATGSFNSFDYSGTIDKFLIGSATSLGTFYLTEYNNSGAQFQKRMGCLTGQLASSLRDTDLPVYPHAIGANVPQVWVEEGFLFYSTTAAATANLNQIIIYPFTGDWDFANSVRGRIVCPKITVGATPSKFYRVVVNNSTNIGDSSMGITPDAYRVLYRTGGIADNSGSWTIAPANGDLSGVTPASEIQFAFEFRTHGTIMMPARILSLALIYETNDPLPSQYRWNYADFNTTTGTFAWVQSQLFGATPGTHTINIYRADTDALVLTQDSTGTTNGTFEYFSGSWIAGLGPDTIGTRRRFTPTASLPSSIDLYAKITVA